METKAMSWAIDIPSSEFSNDILLEVIDFIENKHSYINYVLEDIETNISLPDGLLDKLEKQTSVEMERESLKTLLSNKELQLIELEMTIYNKQKEEYRIIIRDNSCYNVLGNGEKPMVLRSFADLDPQLFSWH